jgi:hypothetical protein
MDGAKGRFETQKGKTLGSNASEMASQEAGHLLENAQEMLEIIDEVGKGSSD